LTEFHKHVPVVFDTKVLKASKNDPAFASAPIWQKRFTTPTQQATDFNY
jgi:hypothetical protein